MFTANSTCNLTELDERIHVFILLQNPATRILEDYHRSRHKKSTQHLDYSSTEDNAFIRSILCKNKGSISINDFNKVKTFLKYHAVVLTSNKHKNIMQLFHQKFRPNLDRQKVSKCIEDEHRKSYGQASHLKDDSLAYLQQMYRLNFYDFSIYHNFASDIYSIN